MADDQAVDRQRDSSKLYNMVRGAAVNFVAIALALVVAGFAAVEERVLLSGAALQRAIIGRELFDNDGDVVMSRWVPKEKFCKSGVWLRMGGRAPIEKKYMVRLDRVCTIDKAGKEQCRRVYRSEAGQFYTREIVNDRDGEPHRVEIRNLGVPC